uniref:C-type lectin domain-containing protein n=1 Tax=Acrobeloides nanus TaxID=290746 RepID=A0A914CP99_9BILA
MYNMGYCITLSMNFTHTNPPPSSNTPQYYNINFNNVSCTNANYGWTIEGLPESTINADINYVTFTNVKKPISVPNKCYLLVNTGALPDVANTNCSQLASGGSLVSIDSAFENKEIFDLASNNKNKCAFPNIWIGLHYSNNSWGWTNGDQSTFRKWDSSAGYPKMLDLQQCASMEVNPDVTSNPSFWINEDCFNMECYLCQVLLN